MKKQITSFLLFFIILKGIMTEDDDCSSNFQKEKVKLCHELSNSTTTCHFIDNECKPWYKECFEYNPENNDDFDDDICKSIYLINKDLRKCHVIINGSNKKCEETDKECKELSEELCFDLNLGSNKRCIFINGKCEEHYNYCNGLDESKCSKNIPYNYQKKCIYDGTNCNEVTRYCSDYIEYSNGNSHFSIEKSECSLLIPSVNGKVCTFNENNNKCDEFYQSCTNINDQSECNNINTIDLKNSTTKECFWEDEKCKIRLKLCSEYKKGEGKNLCEQLSPQDPLYKSCYLNEETDTCEEVFTSCKDYNYFLQSYSSQGRDVEKECENVKINDKEKKCIYDKDNNKCIEISRDCIEFKTEDECNLHLPEDNNKRCIFINEICKEEYKNCDIYNDTIPLEKRNDSECESIIPKYNDNKIYKCVFENSNCIKQIILCEDYKGNDEKYCSSLTANDDKHFYCTLKDNKCISEYNDCYYYNKQKNKNKERCESIILPNKNEKCIFNEKYSQCDSVLKKCSEYKGNDPKECESYKSSDDTKMCSYINGSCVEMYNYVFNDCSDYKGNDKSICNSIQPLKYIYNNVYYPDYSSKCILDEFCKKVDKTCSEAKNENECWKITLKNDKKMCVYKNKKCIEQYKTCQLYQDSGEKINEETCKSIIINGDYKNKCFLDNDGKCISQPKSCSDFNIELLGNKCYEYNPIINTKKCSFSYNNCYSINKTNCLELYYSSDANEDICKAASTSNSNTVCTLRIENDNVEGCKEINIQKIAASSDLNNNSQKNYFNKFLYSLLCFLL